MPSRKHDVTLAFSATRKTTINLPTQAATQWDALSTSSSANSTRNGHPATSSTVARTRTAPSSSSANKMVGRALANVAAPQRRRASPGRVPDHDGDLDATAKRRIEVRRADFVIVRTGQMEDRAEERRSGRRCAWASLREPGPDPCEEIRGNLQRVPGGTRRSTNDTATSSPWNWGSRSAIGIVRRRDFRSKRAAEDRATALDEFFCGAAIGGIHAHRLIKPEGRPSSGATRDLLKPRAHGRGNLDCSPVAAGKRRCCSFANTPSREKPIKLKAY